MSQTYLHRSVLEILLVLVLSHGTLFYIGQYLKNVEKSGVEPAASSTVPMGYFLSMKQRISVFPGLPLFQAFSLHPITASTPGVVGCWTRSSTSHFSLYLTTPPLSSAEYISTFILDLLNYF